MGCGASAERRSAPSASFHGPTAMELQALIQSYRLRIVQVQRCDVRQAHSIPERRHAERLHAAADAVARPTAACRASCTTCVDEHDMRGEAAESRCTGSSQQSLSAVLPCCTVDMDQEMVMDEALLELSSSYDTLHWPKPCASGVLAPPMPPNRSLHEWHLAKLELYIGKIEKDPRKLAHTAEAKRSLHALRLERNPAYSPEEGRGPPLPRPDPAGELPSNTQLPGMNFPELLS
ncbi:unnamed protein product [Durusdinium trenchii]|uniref:Uncharacterized protein n=1 Tax=Durusdinium trenchii TaxID=1381693 RepID=A0ABP0RK00_9DINO